MDSLDRIEIGIEALKESQLKTDIQLAKTDTQLSKTDIEFKVLAKIMSNIGINHSLVAEEFFYYALKEKMKFGDIEFNEIDLNIKGRNKSVHDEFDIIMYNGNSIALIEIKHKVHPNDIEVLKTKKNQNFKTLFPDYKEFDIYLGIGGMSIPSEIEQLAKNEGIAVLRQSGQLAIIEDKLLKKF